MNKKIASQLFMAFLCLLPLIGMAQPKPSPDLIISNLKVTNLNTGKQFSNAAPFRYEFEITNIGNASNPVENIEIQAYITTNSNNPQSELLFKNTYTIDEKENIEPEETTNGSGNAAIPSMLLALPLESLLLKLEISSEAEGPNSGNNTKYAFIKPPKYKPIKEEVVKRQLIIDWNSLKARINNPIDFKKIIDLLSNNADKVATCDCKSRIELWEVEEGEDLDAILSKTIDTDGGTKSAREVVENDSDQNILLNIGLNPKMQGFEVLLKDEPVSYASYQRDVSVYLIDSGVSTEFFGTENHPTAWRHFKSAASYCSAEKSQGYNYTNPPNIYSDYHDENGHGTFGFHAITSGLPDKVKVVPLKAFDKCGQGTLFGLICAMNHAVENEADIINISAGYLGKPSSLLEDVIKIAKTKGIWIVAAAGNDCKPIDSLDDSQYPAAYAATHQNVISVASLDTREGKVGKYAKTSNHGENTVTIAAYGNKICQYANKKYPVFNSGTSMAAYHVTRALAIEISTSGGSANFNLKEFINSNSNESTTDPDKPSKPILKMTSSKPKSKFIPAIRNFLRSIGIDA